MKSKTGYNAMRNAKYALLIAAEYEARVLGASDVRKGLRSLIDKLHPAGLPRYPIEKDTKVAPVHAAKKLPAQRPRVEAVGQTRYLVGLTADGKPIFKDRLELTGTDG